MAALGAVDRAGPARPDVHLHELPQPGLPREGRRHLRHRLRRAGRDGHRRRLVRARVARLRLRLPAAGRAAAACSTRACRSCARPGRRAAATLDGKHYQVDGAIVRPLPLQEGGIPLWIAGGGEKVTLKIAAKYAQYTNFDGTLRGLHAQVRAARRALPRRRHRLRRDRPLGQLQRRDRRHRGRGRGPVAAAQGPDRRRSSEPERAEAPAGRVPRAAGLRHARADRGEPAQARGRGNDLRDLLLPGGRLRPVGHRAVRARGHPGAGAERATADRAAPR